jgi:secondary thiamine-phosphate synthase enzyme
VHELRVETTRKTELVDVTPRVREVVDGTEGSAVVLYVPHTTAGIVVQADGGLAVARDVEAALECIVDESWEWEHTQEEGDRNPWSHVRAALTASSLTIPLRDGELALGRLQALFFCEFDGPRSRSLYVTIVSERTCRRHRSRGTRWRRGRSWARGYPVTGKSSPAPAQ